LRPSSLPRCQLQRWPQLPFRNTLFQFRRNHKFLLARIVFDAKHIRFATDLAILYIGLAAARRLIHRGLVGLAASGALESGLHTTILGRNRGLVCRCIRPASADTGKIPPAILHVTVFS
jgi:hypothetical protein